MISPPSPCRLGLSPPPLACSAWPLRRAATTGRRRRRRRSPSPSCRPRARPRWPRCGSRCWTTCPGQIGVKVKPYLRLQLHLLIEAMRFNQVQVGWFSALPALEAIDRADAEVLARTSIREGGDSYTSVLIVRKGTGITLDSVLACGKTLRLRHRRRPVDLGHAGPMAYLFTPREHRPGEVLQDRALGQPPGQRLLGRQRACWTWPPTTPSASVFLRTREPAASPTRSRGDLAVAAAAGELGIVVRKDLDPALKEKIRQFFLTYGQGDGPEADTPARRC